MGDREQVVGVVAAIGFAAGAGLRLLSDREAGTGEVLLAGLVPAAVALALLAVAGGERRRLSPRAVLVVAGVLLVVVGLLLG